MFTLYRFNQKGGVEFVGRYEDERECCNALQWREHPVIEFFAEEGDRYIQFKTHLHPNSLSFFIYATPVRLESILTLLERKY